MRNGSNPLASRFFITNKYNMIVYVDMDGVLCDFKKAYRSYKDKYPEVEYPQSVKGFFETLEPIEGAIEAINKLIKNTNTDVYILTAPSKRNPLSYMEKRIWVEKYLGFDMVKKLIISPNKALLKGDYLIDDCISGNGQDKFSGKLIHFGSDSFPDWKKVLKHFKL